ncbi:hypothetical protein [Ralstonia pickettii]|uniref:hypothetical protein n=1 Tax=Ralstonia pickettii TaxID=329 RepID=UPI00131C63D3|nr:hypothetical protein [Ralstonia pickettii]
MGSPLAAHAGVPSPRRPPSPRIQLPARAGICVLADAWQPTYPPDRQLKRIDCRNPPNSFKRTFPFLLVFSSFFSRYAIDIEIIFSRGNRLPPSRKWRSHEEKPAQDSDSSTRFFRANIQNRVLF